MVDNKKPDDLPLVVNYALIFIFTVGLFWAFTSFLSYGILVNYKEPSGQLENQEISCTYLYMFGTRTVRHKTIYRGDCPIFQSFG